MPQYLPTQTVKKYLLVGLWKTNSILFFVFLGNDMSCINVLGIFPSSFYYSLFCIKWGRIFPFKSQKNTYNVSDTDIHAIYTNNIYEDQTAEDFVAFNTQLNYLWVTNNKWNKCSLLVPNGKLT
jgi:hypothetical protein